MKQIQNDASAFRKEREFVVKVLNATYEVSTGNEWGEIYETRS